jgi:ABC-2 type transport system permease protein
MSSYFVSPIAYIVIGFFLLIAGLFFTFILTSVANQAMAAQMQAQRMGGPPEIDVPGLVIRNFIGLVATLALFMTPMLTMGVYAEERRRGTMEMLMTSPLTELQIVLGKFFATFSLYCLMLTPTLIYHGVMSRFSDPPMSWRIMWSGYLGVFLLGAALIALGSFISSLTENQIVAAIVTFVTFLLLWVLDSIVTRAASSTVSEIVKYLSILQHYDSFAQGVIDTSSIIFYVSMTALGIFLTLRSLDSMRWRRA